MTGRDASVVQIGHVSLRRVSRVDAGLNSVTERCKDEYQRVRRAGWKAYSVGLVGMVRISRAMSERELGIGRMSSERKARVQS